VPFSYTGVAPFGLNSLKLLDRTLLTGFSYRTIFHHSSVNVSPSLLRLGNSESPHCHRDHRLTVMTSAVEKSESISQAPKPTYILHRTPWRPPVAFAAQGIYVDLENGQRLIDAVGGAAVACIGNGHPRVVQALKDQVDKVSCQPSLFRGHFLLLNQS
jgi:hypothetical protein